MLEAELGRVLAERGKSVAVAESCTGGLLATRITDVPGASAYFLGAIVAYSNAVKQALLAVSVEVLRRHGAVSSACARAMAQGCLRALGADVALATTGVAGPAGGTARKPVGLVYVALAARGAAGKVRRLQLAGSRQAIRWSASEAALELLAEWLASQDGLEG
ncbi:MAG: CinA family protein [Candidatus Bipolaricaulaceae bacterium]